MGLNIDRFIQATQEIKNVEEEKKEIESKEEGRNEEKAEDVQIDNHSYHDSVSLGSTPNQYLQEIQRTQIKQAREKKEIRVEIEIDEMNEFENILNELKSINNEEDELIKKLLKEYETLIEEHLSLKKQLKMIKK